MGRESRELVRPRRHVRSATGPRQLRSWRGIMQQRSPSRTSLEMTPGAALTQPQQDRTRGRSRMACSLSWHSSYPCLRGPVSWETESWRALSVRSTRTGTARCPGGASSKGASAASGAPPGSGAVAPCGRVRPPARRRPELRPGGDRGRGERPRRGSADRSIVTGGAVAGAVVGESPKAGRVPCVAR